MSYTIRMAVEIENDDGSYSEVGTPLFNVGRFATIEDAEDAMETFKQDQQ